MSKDMFENKNEELSNLLMNMSGGLLPEDLEKDEVDLLKDKYGDNWFSKLGYSEPKYKKPNFN